MDSSKNRIACPLHPSEEIKRIDLDFGSDKELYCIECLLSVKDPVSLGGQLKPVEDFIDTAAKYYDSHRKRITNSVETPSEYLDVLSRQTENLEVVSKQIEDEKKRVQLKFDELTQDFLKIIKQKKDEYFHLLDKQLFNYRYAYIFFEKQLRKAYPKEDDVSLFPTKDELLSKYGKLQNATQLLAFVKNLKEDLNESKIASGDMEWLTPEEARIILIKNISKKLDTIKSKSPSLIDPEADVTKVKEEFEKSFSNMTDKLFSLSNEIEDVVHGEWPKSTLLKSNDFVTIRKWLEKEFQGRKWKLIFKGSKDGQNATAFHKNCNNKGPTVTVIKSKAGKVFGGFLDKAWASTNNYVNTNRSFLFSITAKAKYEQNSGFQTYGAYDYATYGPSFGGGHDIYLANDWTTNSNYCNRHSFNFPDNTTLTGGYNFTVEDVEVFSLDK